MRHPNKSLSCIVGLPFEGEHALGVWSIRLFSSLAFREVVNLSSLGFPLNGVLQPVPETWFCYKSILDKQPSDIATRWIIAILTAQSAAFLLNRWRSASDRYRNALKTFRAVFGRSWLEFDRRGFTGVCSVKSPLTMYCSTVSLPTALAMRSNLMSYGPSTSSIIA